MDITAATFVSAIQDTLAQLNLTLNKARGQCYNGASTMRGLNYIHAIVESFVAKHPVNEHVAHELDAMF